MKTGVAATKNWYEKLKHVRDVIDAALEPIIVVMLALLLAAVSFQVLYRFIIVKLFSFSFPFSEELAIWLLVWITYLSIGICLKEGMHAVVDILIKKLKPRNQAFLYIVLRLFMTAFLLLVVVVGTDLAVSSYNFKSPTMQLPMTFLYLAPVVGSCLMLFQILVEFLGVCFHDQEFFGVPGLGK